MAEITAPPNRQPSPEKSEADHEHTSNVADRRRADADAAAGVGHGQGLRQRLEHARSIGNNLCQCMIKHMTKEDLLIVNI